MGGPIVRTGTTPEFWKNWENVFGGKKSRTSAAKPAPAKEAKGAKKASTKAVAKKAKKTGGKKK
jgi:hypothetical protein